MMILKKELVAWRLLKKFIGVLSIPLNFHIFQENYYIIIKLPYELEYQSINFVPFRFLIWELLFQLNEFQQQFVFKIVGFVVHCQFLMLFFKCDSSLFFACFDVQKYLLMSPTKAESVFLFVVCPAKFLKPTTQPGRKTHTE